MVVGGPNTEKRSQGAVEYLLMLGAVLVIVSSIIALISLTVHGLGSNVSDQIGDIRQDVIDGLVGMISK